METIIEVKQRPILFSTEMVQAILEGRKTQTRRIVKGCFEVCTASFEPNFPGYYHNRAILEINEEEAHTGRSIRCPYGQPGDILWVRETFKYLDFLGDDNGYVFRASENGKDWEENSEGWTWKPSIFMPKEAARIFLETTDVRIERLQDISEEDAVAEGVENYKFCGSFSAYLYRDYTIETPGFAYAKPSFETLWQKINGKESWKENPWVWVIEFKRIEKPW